MSLRIRCHDGKRRGSQGKWVTKKRNRQEGEKREEEKGKDKNPERNRKGKKQSKPT